MKQQRWHHLHPERVREWWWALQPGGASAADGTADETSLAGEPSEAPTKSAFHLDRGHVARMRRAATLEDLYVERAPFVLLDRLGLPTDSRLNRGDPGWLFLVAGALAHVRRDDRDNRSLAFRLGAAASNSGKEAAMTEGRFQRLLRATLPDDFAMHLRRAIQLADRTADVAVLADDLAAWWLERSQLPVPASAVRYRWARDYYLDRKDQPLINSMDSIATKTEVPAQEPTA